MHENIQRGMALLDEHFPDWRNRIDPDTLDMHSCFQCILGQLYTDDPRINPYDDNAPHDPYCLGIELLGIDDNFYDQVKYGFDKDTDTTYDQLTKEWTEALTE